MPNQKDNYCNSNYWENTLTDLFKEILPSILQTKQNLLKNEGDYVPFIINRALSFHYDCILYANQMNMLPHTDKKMQYDYYINSIRPYKRPFQKWLKRESADDLEAIKEYYMCSNEKAKEFATILTEAQIAAIKQKIDKGGLDHVRNKRTIRGENKGT